MNAFLACDECGKEFKEKAYLVRHCLTHRACSHCSKLFTNKKYLERHVVKCEIYSSKNKHEAMKPYLHSYHHLFQLGQHIYHCLQQHVISHQTLSQDQQKALRVYHHIVDMPYHPDFTKWTQDLF